MPILIRLAPLRAATPRTSQVNHTIRIMRPKTPRTRPDRVPINRTQRSLKLSDETAGFSAPSLLYHWTDT